MSSAFGEFIAYLTGKIPRDKVNGCKCFAMMEGKISFQNKFELSNSCLVAVVVLRPRTRHTFFVELGFAQTRPSFQCNAIQSKICNLVSKALSGPGQAQVVYILSGRCRCFSHHTSL